MKIEISEALGEFRKHSEKDMSVVRVELTEHFDGEQKLSWSVYGYKNGESAWSGEFPTFEEALKDWEKGSRPVIKDKLRRAVVGL